MLLFQIILFIDQIQLSSHPMSNLWGQFLEKEHWSDGSTALLFQTRSHLPSPTTWNVNAIFCVVQWGQTQCQLKKVDLLWLVTLGCSALHLIHSRMLKSTFANSVWDSLTACSELYKCICCLISYRWFMWVSRKRNRDVWEKLASKDSVGLSPLPPCHLGLYRTNKGITGPSQHF